MITQDAVTAQLAELWGYAPEYRLGQLTTVLDEFGVDLFGHGLPDLEDREILAVLARHAGDMRGHQPTHGASAEVRGRMVAALADIWALRPDARFGELLHAVAGLCDRHTDQHVTIIDDDELELVLRLELARLRRRAGDEETRSAAEAVMAQA